MSFDREKLKTLALYIIWRVGDVRDFGAIKLNKILWFCDARSYEAYGKSITGAIYIRRKFGPVPKDIEPVLDELSQSGMIRTWNEPYFDVAVKRFAAHAPPDVSAFSADELGLIDWWIKHVVEDHTAATISEKSHDYGWKIANEGEELPLKAFLAKRIREPRTPDELEWAQSTARQLAVK